MRSQEGEPHFVRAGASEIHMDMQKSNCKWTFTRKNAHGHVTRAILCGNLEEKIPDTLSGEHVFYGNLQDKTHMEMSQEPICVEI